MRILLLAPNYIGLHEPIMTEFSRHGYTVVWIEDVDISFNFRLYRKRLNKFRCKVMTFIKQPHKCFWNRVLSEVHEGDCLRNQQFDVFFCINGRTLCPELFEWLNQMPNLKKVLYVWDSSSIFDFYHYKNQFDKCFTFDPRDAVKYSGISYLPFYWFETGNHSEKIKYDISIIGTDHDNRFNIVSHILPQVKKSGLSYFFKVKLFKPDFSHIFFYKFRMRFSKELREIVMRANEQYELSLKSEISLDQLISPTEYAKIMDQSRCILDTDRGLQSGFTPRVIWALARGKRIVTTNTHFIEAPFYNPEQISIISREHPVIDVEFITNNKTYPVHEYIRDLRIDKWITRVLE